MVQKVILYLAFHKTEVNIGVAILKLQPRLLVEIHLLKTYRSKNVQNVNRFKCASLDFGITAFNKTYKRHSMKESVLHVTAHTSCSTLTIKFLSLYPVSMHSLPQQGRFDN